MRPAVRCPGPLNQKSVLGLLQAAVGRSVPAVCSTSRPWASEPRAWTTTPPRTAVDTSVVALGFPLGAAWVRAVWSRLTVASRGVPAWVMLSTAGPGVLLPRPASRVTVATPWPAGAAPARLERSGMAGVPPPRLNGAPGAGHARITEVTGAERAVGGTAPALSEIGCRRPASTYRPASTTITTAANRTRLPRRFLTTHPPQARRRAHGPRPRERGGPGCSPGRDSPGRGIPCRSTARKPHRRGPGSPRPDIRCPRARVARTPRSGSQGPGSQYPGTRRPGCSRGQAPAPRRSGPGWTRPSRPRPDQTATSPPGTHQSRRSPDSPARPDSPPPGSARHPGATRPRGSPPRTGTRRPGTLPTRSPAAWAAAHRRHRAAGPGSPAARLPARPARPPPAVASAVVPSAVVAGPVIASLVIASSAAVPPPVARPAGAGPVGTG